MKSNKTTIVGAIFAALVALQPLLEGTGYHLDKQTATKLVFAALIAIMGYLVKDHDVSGTAKAVALFILFTFTLSSCKLYNEFTQHCKVTGSVRQNANGFKACLECDSLATAFKKATTTPKSPKGDLNTKGK